MQRIVLSMVGGVGVVFLLVIVNYVGAFVYPPLINVSFNAIFWSLGIFSYLFDSLTGQHSVWIPHPLPLMASLVLSILVYSIPVYMVLAYRARQKKRTRNY
jgi:hypothetical protein